MARPHPALVDLARGEPLPRVDDADWLVASAVDHAMTGLLWSAVRDAGGATERWHEDLAALDLLTRRRHRQLWAELGRLAADFAARGIEVATIKGVTSEARWYDREGERPSRDIDLLVAPHAIDRIDDLIDAIEPGHPLAGHAARLAGAGRIQSVELPSRGVSVDVHLDPWKLWVPSRAAADVWATTVPFTLEDGATIRVLSPEASVVQLLLHMNKDRFRRLLGFVDIARLVGRGNLDWVEVERLARLDGLEQAVALGLAAVADVTGVVIPLGRPSGPRATVWSFAWRPAIRLQGDEHVTRYRWRQYLIAILARGRMMDGTRSVLRRVLPDKALVAYRHADRRGPYAWRLLSGRAARIVERRRRSPALRK